MESGLQLWSFHKDINFVNFCILEYVDSLEKELMELKSKNRALRKQIDDTSLAKPSTHVQTTSQQVSAQDPYVQAHIRELNGTIGTKL